MQITGADVLSRAIFSNGLKKAVSISGKYYLFGGNNYPDGCVTDAFDSVVCFDVETMRTDGVPRMPYCTSDPGAAVIHRGNDADDDGAHSAIVVGGGEDGMGFLDTCALYNPDIRRLASVPKLSLCFRWSPLPSLDEARLATCFVWLPDEENESSEKGLVYAIGGLNGNGYATATVEVLDFRYDAEKEEWRSQQDSWGASVPMLKPRWRFGALAHRGRIICVCGRSDKPSATNSVEMFDRKFGQWTYMMDSPGLNDITSFIPCSLGILKIGMMRAI